MIRTDNLPREYPYQVGDIYDNWELYELADSYSCWVNYDIDVSILFELDKDRHYKRASIWRRPKDALTNSLLGELTMTEYRNTLSAWAIDSLFHPEDPVDLGTDFSNQDVIQVWFTKNRDKFHISYHRDKKCVREGLRFVLSEFATDEISRAI